MSVTFGATGLVSIIGSILIARGEDSALSAGIFQLIAITNLVSFTLLLPFEAISSKYHGIARLLLVYGSILIPVFISFLALLLWRLSNNSIQFSSLTIFVYVFSVALLQMVNSILAGSGNFDLLSKGSLAGLLSFLILCLLCLYQGTPSQNFVLACIILSNVTTSVFVLCCLFKDRAHSMTINQTRFSSKTFMDVNGMYFALTLSFGISTFIHNGGIILSNHLNLNKNLIIEFSLTTSLLRIPFTVLSTLASPFRSQIRGLIASDKSERVGKDLIRIELFVLLISIPFSLLATLATRFLLNVNGSTTDYMDFSETQILSFSEILFFAGSLLHIFNSFFLRGIYLVVPWITSLLTFLLVIFSVQSQKGILVFPLITASILLVAAEVFTAIFSLRRLSVHPQHI